MGAATGRDRLPPGFGRFWWSEAVSGFGSSITVLALQTLVVVTLGGSAVEVGWLTSARWLPYLVLGLVVGALVDRLRRRPLMVASDLLRAVEATSTTGPTVEGDATLLEALFQKQTLG